MTASDRSPRWWALTVAFPTLVIGFLAWYLWTNRALFSTLSEVPLDELLLVVAMTALAHYLNATEFGLLHRGLGFDIGYTENWLLFSVGQLGNYLPGQVGTLYRVHYLKTVHRMPYGGSAAVYGINLVVSLLGTGMAGIAGMLILRAHGKTFSWPLFLILVALVLLALVASRIELPARAGGGRLARAWAGVASGWKALAARPTVGLAALSLEVLRFLITAWRLQLTFAWVGFDESYAFFLVIGPIGALVTFIGITPAGLGLREFGVAAASKALGQPFDLGLVGSSTDRAVSLSVVTIVGLVGLAYTSRRVAQVS